MLPCALHTVKKFVVVDSFHKEREKSVLHSGKNPATVYPGDVFFFAAALGFVLNLLPFYF